MLAPGSTLCALQMNSDPLNRLASLRHLVRFPNGKLKHHFLDSKDKSYSQFLWRKNSCSSEVSSVLDPQSLSASMDESGFLNGDHLIGKKRSLRSASQNAGLSKFPSKPKFVQVPSITQQLHLKAGETLIANVNVMAEPPADIHWYMNKFQLKPSVLVQINKPAGNSSTLIHKQPASGLYRIKASNVHGSAVYEMRVIVDGFSGKSSFLSSQSSFSNDEDSLVGVSVRKPEGIKDDLPKAPRLTSAFPNFHRLKEGQGIVLEVRVDAIPEASFLWRQNNFELKNGQNGVAISSNEPNSSQLSLERPIDGRLEVIASNNLGRCVASTKLAIDYISESKNRYYFVEPLPPTFSANCKELSVKVHAQQLGHFQWFSDGERLTENVTEEAFKSTLTLSADLMPKHELIVAFTNPIGKIYSKSRVEDRRTVEPPPGRLYSSFLIPYLVPKKQFRIVNGAVQRLCDQLSTEQKDANVIEVEKINQDFIETTQIEKQEGEFWGGRRFLDKFVH